jgi:translation initiation factor 2 gamma subunit (eIF-2gamma)
LVTDEVAIVSVDWAILGSVVSSPAALIPEFTKILGKLNLIAKVVGTGAEVRIVEDDLAGNPVVLVTAAVADTGDTWTFRTALTGVAVREGAHEYRVEVRLNGASSFSIRSAVLAMLKLL